MQQNKVCVPGLYEEQASIEVLPQGIHISLAPITFRFTQLSGLYYNLCSVEPIT